MFALGLSQSNEIRKPLILVSCHGAIATSLEHQVLLEMLIQMVLQSLISDKAHSTNCAVVLDSLIDLGLSEDIQPTVG